jgi:starch synthase
LEGPHKLLDLNIHLKIPVGFRTYRADIWRTEEMNPATYFIRRDEFFDRSQIYSLTDRDYDDNFERYVFFQKAVVAMMDALELKPDIVHGNDWQTGLIPLFLEHGIQGGWRGRKEKTVFTIHNLAYQGIYSGNDYSITSLPFSCFSVDTMEFYGNINSLKCGVMCSDAVTTVSKTYAKEIQTERDGFGLHGVLQAAHGKLTGIVNGIDSEIWNPEKDRYTARHFGATDMSGKKACKQDVAAELKLKVKPDTALIGMVSRLVDGKGMDLLSKAMPEIMSRNVAFVLLGSGQENYHELSRSWTEMWPGRFAAVLGFDPPLGHRIIAGSDLFFMPSKFEPCGLSQLYSLRYGTIPIVHAVGGLEDTIERVDVAHDRGFGFKFSDYTIEALLGSLDEALALMKKQDAWQKVMHRAMTADFSWTRSAEEYLELYKRLLKPASK